MPLAAKHFDIVLGIDIHIVQPPGTVPPMPIPHPFAGILFDPFDYLPIFGATVLVNGLPRAQAGCLGLAIPPHIPIGGVFVKPPDNDCELFMGSATVTADGEPLGYMGLPVLSCSDIGMPPPTRPPQAPADATTGPGKKPKTKPKRTGPVSMVLPTSVVLPIPSGAPVEVGGPPTISLTAIAARVMFVAGVGALRKLQNTRHGIEFSQRMHRRADRILDRLGVAESTRHRVQKVVCSLTGHPVDVATGKVLTEAVDIDLPGPLALIFERTWYSTSIYRGSLGHGWHHGFDLALSIDNDLTVVRLADGRLLAAPGLAVGESWFDRREQVTLSREARGWVMRDRAGTRYCFTTRSDWDDRGGVVELSAVEDRSGNRIELIRDAEGRLLAFVDSGGRRLPVTCDDQGRIVEIRGPHPDPQHSGQHVFVRYVYDRAGDLVEVHDALGGVMRYAYRDHLLVRETNRVGLSFYFEYDNQAAPERGPDPAGGASKDARCLRTWGDGGIYARTLEYADDHTIVHDSLGAREVYFFNDDGLIVRAVDALGHEISATYDEWTTKLSETNELGRITRYVHDQRGRLIEQVWPDGTTARFSYDEHDQLVRSIDQNGSWWQWRRDERGRLIERSCPDSSRTRLVWAGPRLAAIVDARGGTTSLDYDDSANLVRARLPDGSSLAWSHDRLGRVVRFQDPRGAGQELHRDLAGRLVEVADADGTRRWFSRDAEGRTIRVRQPHSEIEYEWTGLHGLRSQRESGVETRFGYDTEERLVEITNAHGDRYRFERDQRGDVIAEVAWAGDRREFVLDPAGRISKLVHPSGAVVKHCWDRRGRLELVTYDDGSFERYVYREDGLLMLAHNDTCTVKFERDALGRITREWQGEHWVESRLSVTGERVGLRSSFGVELEIERDLMGQWSRLRASETGQVRWTATTQRDIDGEEVDRELQGGARDRWVRDALGRPTQHQVWDGKAVVRDVRYGWEVDDRLRFVLDAVTGQRSEYEHDALGRLAATRRNDETELRLPDALGNLYRAGDRIDRHYGADGRLLRSEELEGARRYEYDDDGRRVRQIDPDGSVSSYRWNRAGRLVAVVRPDGEEVGFGYDALGRRVFKTFQDRTTRWVWDGDVILHEWTEGELHDDAVDDIPIARNQPGNARDAKGEPKNARGPPLRPDDDETAFVAPAFVPAPTRAPTKQARGFVPDEDSTGYVEPAFVSRAVQRGGPQLEPAPVGLVTWVSNPDSLAPIGKLSNGRAYSVVCNHLGTPVRMLDERGRSVWAAELSTWGELRLTLGEAVDCPHRFAGQYEDVETGLVYNRYRYFDPQAGQYLCVDPIRLAGGLNSFAYVGDPLTAVDPLGLAELDSKGCGGHIALGFTKLHHLKGAYSHKAIGLRPDGSSASTVVERLQQFSRERGATYWEDWGPLPGDSMKQMVLDRARHAERIHFNLDGFRNKGSSLRDTVRRGREGARRDGDGPGRTERELYWILKDTKLRDNTTFYRGGRPVENPEKLFGDVWDIK
jgi:RHS repeat-associated protein